MAIRKRVLKYKPAVGINQRELVKKLLENKPRINLERERFFATLVHGVKRARKPTKEEERQIEEFVKMRKEIEDEERAKTEKPRLGGETEELVKHTIKPVPKRNREFAREDVSIKLKRWKEERKILNKHK